MRIDQICDGSASNCPAVNASGEETRRTPERLQANLRRVYGMQSSKTLDQLTAQQRADRGPAKPAGRVSRITIPGRYSMIWNGAPSTLASSQKNMARGASGYSCHSDERMRYSRVISLPPYGSDPA